MTFWKLANSVAVVAVVALPVSAQQPTVEVDGDDITVTGCVTRSSALPAAAPDLLVWTRGDIMMAGAAIAGQTATPSGTTGLAGKVLYWLDDDEDLVRYIGQRVEIKGELEDFEKGEVEIDRQGDFTEIELDLDGKEEKVRVPTAWLAGSVPHRDVEFDIIAREVDIEHVRVIGSCIP